jgi:hypothetical protein
MTMITFALAPSSGGTRARVVRGRNRGPYRKVVVDPAAHDRFRHGRRHHHRSVKNGCRRVACHPALTPWAHEEQLRHRPEPRGPLRGRAATLVQKLPVVSTGVGEFASTFVLAVSDALACLLESSEMPASELFISAAGRLCDRPPREAEANVLQCCARQRSRALWTAGTLLGSAGLSGMGLDDRIGRPQLDHSHSLHRVFMVVRLNWRLCSERCSCQLPGFPVAALWPRDVAVVEISGGHST